MEALEFIDKLPEFLNKNFFFICGEEAYLLDYSKKVLLDAFNIQFPEFNLITLKGKMTFGELYNSCLQAPCFSNYRVVILEDIDISEKTISFEQIMHDLPNQTKLLLFYTKQPDMRKTIYKEAKKRAVYIEANALKGDQLCKWLITVAKKQGIVLLKNTAELIIEISGGEMYTIKNEVQKLKYVGLKKPSAEEIQSVVAGSIEYDIFKFHSDMMAGKCTEAFEIFEKIRKDRNALIGFIGLMVSKFSPMYMARLCVNAGMSDRQIAEQLSRTIGIKIYPALFAARDCRAFRLEQIKASLRELERIDQLLKKGAKLTEYKLFFLKIYAKI